MKLYCCSYIDENKNQITHFLRTTNELSRTTFDVKRKGFKPTKTIIDVTETVKRTVIPLR